MNHLKRMIKIKSIDIIMAVIVLVLIIWISHRVKSDLHYTWNWKVIPQYLIRYDDVSGKWLLNTLMIGLLTTIKLSIWAMICGMIIGVIMGFFRVSQSLFRRMLGATFVGIIRNLPPLVLMFIFYFFVSDQILAVFRIDALTASYSNEFKTVISFLFSPTEILPSFCSALVTLSIYEGAYITEIMRAGIQSIEKGQWEASSALGFTWIQAMQHVIFPQAFKRILPPLGSQFISTIKDSAIVSVISVQDLTFQGMELMSSTYLTFEIWITVTILYLVLTLFCSLGVRFLEKRLRKNDR